MERFMERFMDILLMVMLGSTILFTLGFVGFIARDIIEDYRTPTYVLKQSEWSCTQTTPAMVTHLTMVGKVMIPHREIENVCIQYNAN